MKLHFTKLLFILFALIVSCDDDDVNVFEKTADERAAEAIAALKSELVAPAHGWKMKYTPSNEGGSFYILLDFDENNKVHIQSDLGANDGEYFSQTISYRIDNSHGIELIFETYSIFQYLYELDQATFPAEYEFLYVNKTPGNELVFASKSDVSNKTIVLFEPATAADQAILGQNVATNLATIANDFDIFSSSLKIVFTNKDLILYASLDQARRTVSIVGSSRKSNTQNVQQSQFTSGFALRGDSISFNSRLSGNFSGSNLSIKGIRLNIFSEGQVNLCGTPLVTHNYSGETSQGDLITLESTLMNAGGATFKDVSDFYFSPINYILKDRQVMATQIQADVKGALEMHLYYNIELNDGSILYGIGFALQNDDGTQTLALKEFTPTLVENNLIFEFKPGFRLFGSQTPSATLENTMIYLNALTEGNATYVLPYAPNIFEFHNPCSGWTAIFVNGNQ